MATRQPRQNPGRRVQARERPGKLLHLDAKRLARFERVGHRVTDVHRGASDSGAAHLGTTRPVWAPIGTALDPPSDLTRVLSRAFKGRERARDGDQRRVGRRALAGQVNTRRHLAGNHEPP